MKVACARNTIPDHSLYSQDPSRTPPFPPLFPTDERVSTLPGVVAHLIQVSFPRRETGILAKSVLSLSRAKSGFHTTASTFPIAPPFLFSPFPSGEQHPSGAFLGVFLLSFAGNRLSYPNRTKFSHSVHAQHSIILCDSLLPPLLFPFATLNGIWS